MSLSNFIYKIGLCTFVFFNGFIYSAVPQSASIIAPTHIDCESLTHKFRSVRSMTALPETVTCTGQYWGLSLDGGGIRGIMHLHALAALERQTGRKIIDLFDAISGTSVGGLIATVLTLPDDSNPALPKYSPQSLLDILMLKKADIFKTKWQSIFGLFRTRYKTTSLKKILQDLLGNNNFKNRLLPTVVVTTDLNTYEERLFSTTDTEDFYTKDLAMATAAAPTFFKPQRVMPIGISDSHVSYLTVDGGMCMQNPVLACIALIHKQYRVAPDHISILSLGTGRTDAIRSSSPLKRGGILSWISELPTLFMAGQESTTESVAKFYCRERYHRFNPIVSQSNMDFANISKTNIHDLLAASQQMLGEHAVEFGAVANALMVVAAAKPEETSFVRTVYQAPPIAIVPQKSLFQQLLSYFYES